MLAVFSASVPLAPEVIVGAMSLTSVNDRYETSRRGIAGGIRHPHGDLMRGRGLIIGRVGDDEIRAADGKAPAGIVDQRVNVAVSPGSASVAESADHRPVGAVLRHQAVRQRDVRRRMTVYEIARLGCRAQCPVETASSMKPLNLMIVPLPRWPTLAYRLNVGEAEHASDATHIDLITLGLFEILNIVQAATIRKNEGVRAGAAGEDVIAAAAIEPVVAALAFEVIVYRNRPDRVVEVRSADAFATPPVIVSFPTELLPVAVPATRSTVTPPVALVNVMRVLPLPVMVSLPPRPSNSLKVPLLPADVEAPACAELRRHIGVGEVGAAHRFDRAQRIGPDRRIARDRAGRHVDADACRHRRVVAVDRLVEAAAAVDEVVAGPTFELARGIGGLLLPAECIVELRARDRR